MRLFEPSTNEHQMPMQATYF